jgi:hypothetical protein
MKNKIDTATAHELNDSLDYQNINEYESVKSTENRVSMY